MNLPNKLSLIRVSCIPFIIFFLSFDNDTYRFIALGIFLFASFTDFLDGFIARKKQLITDFGKFIDPIADKLLVLSTTAMLLSKDLIPAWFLILLLFREFSVDGLRLIAVTKGKVIAAGPLGKIKTVTQMLLIVFLLILNIPALSSWFTLIILILSSFFTLVSGIDYFYRNSFLITNHL